jgi:hypothetical protein
LSITANPPSKTYGTLLAFGAGSTNFTASGLQNGETIESVTLVVGGNGDVTNAPVATYIITPGQATGGTFTPANYNIGYNTGTLTVTAATNLTSSITWTTLSANTADTNGVFSFTDLSASNYVNRYYRTATQ